MLFCSELFGITLTTSTVHKVSAVRPGSGTLVCVGDGLAVGVVIAGRASARRRMTCLRRKAMIGGLLG